MFERIDICFMTGTGNSYKVAVWFAEVAKELFGLQANMQQVKTDRLSTRQGRNTLCVFTLPTHGFTAPWLMLKQIVSLPRGKGTSAVVLASRAGIRVKGIFLPGMEGTAGYITACLLFFKGYTVRGVIGIDMPSNWTALHWGLSKDNVEFIISAAQPKVKHFAQTVLAGQLYFDGIVPLVIGLGLAPVSFMYLIMAQFFLAKLFFASDECRSCGLCVRCCPQNAIVMKGIAQKRPYWTFSCDSCMACINYCPYRAIEVSPLVAIIFYYLMAVPVWTYVLSHILPVSWFPTNGEALIQYVLVLLSIFFGYLLLHSALGWRLFSLILSRLSHTHYFRRYHAPDVSVKELLEVNKK